MKKILTRIKAYFLNRRICLFCNNIMDIEMSDFGEEHWENIRENKYPGSYKLVKSKLENEGKFG